MRSGSHRYVKAKALAERRRKLRIPRFRPRAKSSLTPLLLLSPPNPPDGWASAGTPFWNSEIPKDKGSFGTPFFHIFRRDTKDMVL